MDQAVQGFLALLELVASLVALMVRTLFRGFVVLAQGPPADTGIRGWLGHVLLSFAPFLLVVGCTIGGLCFLDYRLRIDRENRDQAKELVDAWADKLIARRVKNGRLEHVDAIPVVDPWERRLLVKYEGNKLGETVTVRSIGPDRECGTLDDIEAKRSVTFPDAVKKKLVHWAVKAAAKKLRRKKKP